MLVRYQAALRPELLRIRPCRTLELFEDGLELAPGDFQRALRALTGRGVCDWGFRSLPIRPRRPFRARCCLALVVQDLPGSSNRVSICIEQLLDPRQDVQV